MEEQIDYDKLFVTRGGRLYDVNGTGSQAYYLMIGKIELAEV